MLRKIPYSLRRKVCWDSVGRLPRRTRLPSGRCLLGARSNRNPRSCRPRRRLLLRRQRRRFLHRGLKDLSDQSSGCPGKSVYWCCCYSRSPPRRCSCTPTRDMGSNTSCRSRPRRSWRAFGEKRQQAAGCARQNVRRGYRVNRHGIGRPVGNRRARGDPTVARVEALENPDARCCINVGGGQRIDR